MRRPAATVAQAIVGACLVNCVAMASDEVVRERDVGRFERQYPSDGANVMCVDVELGGDDVDSTTTIKAEDRRLLALGVHVPAGGTQSLRFLVSTRQPGIIAADGGQAATVGLKPREVGSASWDEQLTLEFLGDPPRVRRVAVAPASRDELTMVFVAGDSTVTDQASEPYAGWGQMLPAFFGPMACVANLAQSGLTLRSFAAQRRLAKILVEMRPGDFVLVQFGHNDQKDKREGAGAFTTYADGLRHYVDLIRERGGRPVLVTPVGRRRFDAEGRVTESLGDFPDAVRRVAAETGVPLVDLNASSKRLYQALGVEGSRRVFLHGSFPGRTEPLKDDSHFSNYGAHQIARCVVESIRAGIPELAALLREDVRPFDPDRPDEPDAVATPPSRGGEAVVPEGS
jgi:lysophospholipase L1-like esterase